jgi:DNA-binding MarR family transcriptional regulator
MNEPQAARRRRSRGPRPRRSSLLFDLFVAQQRVRALLTDAMEGSGLRPDEYAVYSAVSDFGPVAPGALAQILGMPPTTMSHYVRSMREQGHVETVRNPADNRSFLLALTPDGRTAHRRAGRAFDEAYRRFVAALPAGESSVRTAVSAVEQAAAQAREELNATRDEAIG